MTDDYETSMGYDLGEKPDYRVVEDGIGPIDSTQSSGDQTLPEGEFPDPDNVNSGHRNYEIFAKLNVGPRKMSLHLGVWVWTYFDNSSQTFNAMTPDGQTTVLSTLDDVKAATYGKKNDEVIHKSAEIRNRAIEAYKQRYNDRLERARPKSGLEQLIGTMVDALVSPEDTEKQDKSKEAPDGTKQRRTRKK